MTDLMSLPSQKRVNAADALFSSTGFKRSVIESDKKLFTQYPIATGQVSNTVLGMRAMFHRHFGKELEVPRMSLVESSQAIGGPAETRKLMDASLRLFCESVVENLVKAGCGRIVWHDDTRCSFDYPEAKITKTLTKRIITTVRHRHDLVDARQHKLPCDVPRPRTVDMIIREIPSVLHPYLRVVTGLEMVKSSIPEGQSEELNGFGRFLQGAGAAASNGMAAAAKFASNGMDTAARIAKSGIDTAGRIAGDANVQSGVATVAGVAALGGIGYWLATIAAQVAILDPALCLGDVVLCGWEN
jgi:hypothetical protein